MRCCAHAWVHDADCDVFSKGWLLLSSPSLRQANEWRQGRLVSSEYDETTWAARNYMAFVAQRISVAAHISLAQEIAKALGLSVAADPRE